MNSLNIMVVDDSGITSKKLIAMLESMGHKVVCTAKTGTEAVSCYRQHNPDLVTMDITMPDMDGVEATKLIMDEFKDALIIMVTSHGQEEMVMNAVKAGAKGYVLKPVDPEKLKEHIAMVFKRYKE
jgi:two-component system, chemotaxis family, chemotaxis protein CheY